MTLVYLLACLGALSATGNALSCKACVNSNTFCYGPSMACPRDNVCASSYTVTSVNHSPVQKVFITGCAPTNQCNISGTFSMPNGDIKMSSTCCVTDNCTPPTPVLPVVGTQANRATCQTCASVDSSSCYSDETMQCTGDEDQCLLQNTETYAPLRQSVAVRGCATKSLCDLGTQRVEAGNMNMVMTFTCNGGSGLRSSFLFCITAAFSVLKLVFSK